MKYITSHTCRTKTTMKEIAMTPRRSWDRTQVGLAVVGCGALLALAGCVGQTNAQDDGEWEPSKPITIVVGASPGGGFDQTAQLVKQVGEETGIIDQPIRLQYQEGAGGTIALRTINQYEGDAHHLAVLGVSPIVIDVTGNAAVPVSDTTPIARLYDEPILFAVKADSDIKSAEDMLKQLKDDPKSLTIGISTSLGNHNHMAVGLAASAAGIDASELKVVVFDSGSKTTNALLSGDVDVVPAPASSFGQLAEAGEVEGIVVSTPERLETFEDVPTWSEVGIGDDATFSNWRGLAGPKDMTDGQVEYWDETLEKLTSSDEWKEALAEMDYGPDYTSSDELASWIQSEKKAYEKTLEELGVL